MQIRNYTEVKSILSYNDTNRFSAYNKFKFFKSLELAVYNGITPDKFRRAMNLPVLFQPMGRLGRETDQHGRVIDKPGPLPIPYWEIHYYHVGFTTMHESEAKKHFFDPVVIQGHESHFYFTFKSKIKKDFYTDLKQQGVISKSSQTGLHVINGNIGIGRGIIDDGYPSCFLNEKYTGISSNQRNTDFKLRVF